MKKLKETMKAVGETGFPGPGELVFLYLVGVGVGIICFPLIIPFAALLPALTPFIAGSSKPVGRKRRM